MMLTQYESNRLLDKLNGQSVWKTFDSEGLLKVGSLTPNKRMLPSICENPGKLSELFVKTGSVEFLQAAILIVGAHLPGTDPRILMPKPGMQFLVEKFNQDVKAAAALAKTGRVTPAQLTNLHKVGDSIQKAILVGIMDYCLGRRLVAS
ncbi:MAG: hypothetical protein MZW92_31500 [Comamonadaceae bacterium]|nr:hypothetical protein [Comamonadaceae bacterium]